MKEVWLRICAIVIASLCSFVFALIWPFKDATIESLIFVSLAYLLPAMDFILIWRHRKRFSVRDNPNETPTYIGGRAPNEPTVKPFLPELARETTLRIAALILPTIVFTLVNPILALAIFFLYLMDGAIGVYFISTKIPPHKGHNKEEQGNPDSRY